MSEQKKSTHAQSTHALLNQEKNINIQIDGSLLTTDFKVKLANQDKLKYSFEVVIGTKYLNETIDDFALKRYLQENPNIQGFAQGKAPLFVIKKHYAKVFAQNADRLGVRSLEEYILVNEIRRVLAVIVQEYDLKPAIDPQYTSMNPYVADQDYSFSFDIEVMPDLPKVDLEKLEVHYPTVEVAEKDVTKAMNEWASKNVHGVALSKARPAKDGDTIILDMAVAGDAKPIEGFTVRIGQGMLAKDFEEALVGKNIGDTFSHILVLPANFHDSGMAGRSFKIKVTIRDIQETENYKVDIEMAKALNTPSVEAMKDKFHAQLTTDTEKIALLIAKRDLMKKLGAVSDTEVPEAMLQKNLFGRVNNLAGQVAMNLTYPVTEDEQKAIKDKMIEMFGKDYSAWIEEQTAQAKSDIRSWLILLEYAREHNIQVTKAELDEEISKRSPIYGGLKEALEYFEKNIQARMNLETQLREDKIVKEMLRFVKAKKEKVSLDQLQELSEKIMNEGAPKQVKSDKKVAADKAESSEEKQAKAPAKKSDKKD